MKLPLVCLALKFYANEVLFSDFLELLYSAGLVDGGACEPRVARVDFILLNNSEW